jgi:probable rRNA maturation factor
MTLQSEGYRRGTLEVAVVGEAEMRGQHRRWKGSAAVTDVLSFDLRERPRRSLVDGQLIVCGPTARKRAKRRGGDWRGELLLYVVHGCLHLCDYDDATATAAARMHRLEDDLLAALGWGRVFSSGLRKESPRGRSGRRARAGTE